MHMNITQAQETDRSRICLFVFVCADCNQYDLIQWRRRGRSDGGVSECKYKHRKLNNPLLPL